MEYTSMFIMLAIIFLIVMANRFLFWWIKATIVAYYSVISYIFIKTKNKIDRQYENILPVPDIYWDKNSGWVDTMAGYYFWPLAVILLFIYYKWYRSVQSKTAKGLVVVSFIPSAAIFLFITFLFGFGYGYRP
ncbi:MULTISPECIES: hypothetical protein [Bacillales]|uniref:hypothetical protein n=1 Tax=Peribacillus TaxID=2675229 RepID=UPI00177C03AA|nr:hypothetical protein [Brevibacillus sp. JNUCC-41]QOS89444.1 hypothetical protein JNUCC41_22315 [Brevibacillus sp. JNUCC-41]